MPEQNDKYITFARDEEWERFTRDTSRANLMPAEIPDAVIIRRQDVFAGPAFDSYANIILASIETIRYSAGTMTNDILDRQLAQLQRAADYFHEQAELAAHSHKKLPD